MSTTTRRVRKSPLVADPKAMERIRDAADSIGATLEELADLVVDSGVLTLPPDKVTERYTLEDLGKRLWAVCNTHVKSKRPAWFAALSPTQQAALIVHWRNYGFSTALIASELELDERFVRETYHRHADDVGAQVVGVRLNTIAGQMQLVAEQIMERAFEEGDYKTAWKVERDRVRMLQDLGIVDKAIHKVEVTHKIDEQTEDELRKLVELRQKRITREEEVKRIEFTETDPVPDMPGLEAEK